MRKKWTKWTNSWEKNMNVWKEQKMKRNNFMKTIKMKTGVMTTRKVEENVKSWVNLCMMIAKKNVKKEVMTWKKWCVMNILKCFWLMMTKWKKKKKEKIVKKGKNDVKIEIWMKRMTKKEAEKINSKVWWTVMKEWIVWRKMWKIWRKWKKNWVCMKKWKKIQKWKKKWKNIITKVKKCLKKIKKWWKKVCLVMMRKKWTKWMN